LTASFFSITSNTARLNFLIDPSNPLTPISSSITSLAGLLSIDLLDGSPMPQQTDQFVLLSSPGSISGSFVHSPNGSRIGTDGGTFLVSYGSGSALGANRLVLSDFQVPEPTGVVVIAAGAFGLAGRRRRAIRK